MLRYLYRIVTPFITALLLNGCGIKGPLYSPPHFTSSGSPMAIWDAVDHSNKTASITPQRT